MDSVTLAHKIAQENELIGLISFDYGQRHKKELDYAKACADALNTEHILIDITNIGRQLTGSALTDNIDVPDGHYAEDTMKITVVPNRNAIMLTIAYGIAVCSRRRGRRNGGSWRRSFHLSGLPARLHREL
jgi:7-cyano-7-deazaguanine synthase